MTSRKLDASNSNFNIDFFLDNSFNNRVGGTGLQKEAVMDLITKEQGSTVADLGCGNGTLTEKLAERGYLVQGIDDSEDMLQLAGQEHPDCHFIKGNAVSFQLEENVDVIFSNAVFHWIDEKDQQAMLCNIHRNLKPGANWSVSLAAGAAQKLSMEH